MCHVSRVMYNVSCVTCHMSQKKGQSGEASPSRVCYQQGLPCLVIKCPYNNITLAMWQVLHLLQSQFQENNPLVIINAKRLSASSCFVPPVNCGGGLMENSFK